jgi:hypothetical protein
MQNTLLASIDDVLTNRPALGTLRVHVASGLNEIAFEPATAVLVNKTFISSLRKHDVAAAIAEPNSVLDKAKLVDVLETIRGVGGEIAGLADGNVG